MKEQVMIGVFTLLGSLIGGFFVFASSRQEKRWNSIEKDLKYVCEQVSSYFILEKIYSKELAQKEKLKQVTILKKMRDKVVESGDFNRPVMTANDATKIKDKWRL